MNALLIILAIIGFPFLLAFSAIWRGYVLSILWGWFIVPLFGLPALSIPFAIGFSLIVGYMTHQATKTEDEPSWGTLTAHAALLPAFILLIGWIVTKFI